MQYKAKGLDGVLLKIRYAIDQMAEKITLLTITKLLYIYLH